MKTPSIGQRLFFVAAAVVMLGLSATMAWATVNEYGQRGTVPVGVRVAGTDLSGMDAEQAAAAIERTVADPLMRPITVSTPLGTKTFAAKKVVSADTGAMLDDAFKPRAQSTFTERLASSFGQPADYDVKPLYVIDRKKIAAWVGSQAKAVNRPSVDATLTVKGAKPVATAEKYGRTVDKKLALKRVATAVESDTRSVKLPVKILSPKVTKKDLPKIIIVQKSTRRLTLYKGDKKLRAWSVAIGQPAYPTPNGKWTVVNKRFMPTWTNNGSAWAASMPPYIAPGYSNPLGLRALDLDASGIRIHGTANIGSIGTAASHGCIRMANSNVVELYPMVPVGTSVYVIP